MLVQTCRVVGSIGRVVEHSRMRSTRLVQVEGTSRTAQLRRWTQLVQGGGWSRRAQGRGCALMRATMIRVALPRD